MANNGRFPSPFDVKTPPGGEGWQDLYPYYLVFSEDRRMEEEAAFWFQDGVHWREVLYPGTAAVVLGCLGAVLTS